MDEKELLLVPGPTPVIGSIQEAISQPTMNHTDPRFVKIFKNAIERTKEFFKTDGEVFLVSGSGTLAMEMALVNTVGRGEKIIIISHGYFGDRFIKLGAAFGIEIDVIQADWGKQVSAAEVEAKLAADTYKAVTITHADTSTGVAANLDELVPVIKKYGALVIVDGVCATAAMEEDMSKTYGDDSYKIDIVLTGSQKAFGVPPGLAIIAFNQSAMKVRKELGQVPAYYADIYNWLPIMEDPSRYFATPPVNLIYGFNHAIELVHKEGLEARYKRHQAYARGIRAAIASYGMMPLAEADVAATTLTCFRYPEGINDAAFRSKLAEKGVVVAGALAHLAGKALRIGHMGNTAEQDLKRAVRLIGESLNELDYQADIEKAIDLFVEHRE